MAETGAAVNFEQFEAQCNQTAHLLRSLGLKRGDCVAALFDNGPEILELTAVAERAGLYIVAVSNRLTAAEVQYLVEDSGSRYLFTTGRLGTIVHALPDMLGSVGLFASEGGVAAYRDWKAEAAAFPTTPISDQSMGGLMLYSSGTTGRPKGIRRPLPDGPLTNPTALTPVFTRMFGANAAWTYLSPAPLYHAAPLGWAMEALRTGCTVVVMEKFDARGVLDAIARYSVNIAQFVPTHFVRLLKLTQEERAPYDLSSLRTVFHAAAPCPIPIKEAMLDWWGPIIHEYYSGTEGCGFTLIGPAEWRERQGSVGRALGCVIHICDEIGSPVPVGQDGQVFFSGGPVFEYHNDPEKTAESRHALGWATLGDIGHIDEDGYLYLTDRKSFTIITGGVNVYPQEIENILATHPLVEDVAVIGAPDEEMGERVVAVIQRASSSVSDDDAREALRAFCRSQLSGVKTPRQIDFVDELPRHPTGKLYKRLVRDRYWAKAEPAVDRPLSGP